MHAYYAVYGALQAWFAANGMTGVADDHTATLRSIANILKHRRLFPSQWDVLSVGCPMRGDRLYLNDPENVGLADNIEVLTIPIACEAATDF